MSCGKCGCGKGRGLCPISFGLAVGIACGLFMMVFAWMVMQWNYGTDMMTQYASLYPGYEPTWMGGVKGGLWGLLEGFVFGFVIALFYDFFICCKAMCCRKSAMTCNCTCGSSSENKSM